MADPRSTKTPSAPLLLAPILLAPVLLTMAAGCTAAAARDDPPAGQRVSRDSGRSLDQALAGLTPGKPTSCLPLTRTPPSQNYGRTVLYRVSRNEVWRNDTGPGCEGLARGDVMVIRSPTGRFCRGDIIQLVDQVTRFPTGSCALSDFVPYRRSK